MYIKELSVDEFNNFKKNHPLNNHHQSVNYALLKSENNYEYELIGYTDGEKIYAAACVLVKLINGYIYAYIPEGYLIDYMNEELLRNFTKDLITYYEKEEIIFIKVNPSLKIRELDNKGNIKNIFPEEQVQKSFNRLGYKLIEEKGELTNVLPLYNAVVNLEEFSLDNLNKNTKNKIRKAIRKGLTIQKFEQDKLYLLNELVRNKKNTNIFYYNDYYNIFARTNDIDLFLVNIDYNEYSNNSQKAYSKEEEKNKKLNENIIHNSSIKAINKKMSSDKSLLSYKNDVSKAAANLQNDKEEYIAGALVIKNEDTVTILISGYDKKYNDFAANYFLYYKLMEYYKGKFKYFNLNGISKDLSKNSKFYGLNSFKLGFKPHIYETLGEYDLIIKPRTYNYLKKKRYLKSEFSHK